MWLKRHIVYIVFTFTLPVGIASAQVPLDFGGAGAYQPELTFSPLTPEPGDQVNVSIGNFVSALQGSEITWSVDGVVLAEGRNEANVTIQAGPVDDPTVVSARLRTLSGDTLTVQGEVTARYVDIIVEPQTHVPSFYSGRPLPSPSSQVNVTALINGKTNDQLVYNWRLEDQTVGALGGRGQYTTQFDMPLDSRPVLSLDIFTLSGELYARKAITVPNNQPFLRFHEVHSLYGPLENSYDSFILSGNNATLLAVPYYLDRRVYNNAPNASWSVDGQTIPASGNPYELTIERMLDSGRATISFELRSTTALLQGVRGSLPVFF